MTTETTQQEIILLPELPPVPSRTEDEQATYNTKAFNFRAAERELQQKFNINVPLLNTVLKSSTDILPNMDAIENVAGNMVNITAVAAHSSDITTVAASFAHAGDSATAAGQSAQDAAASAGQAATSEANARASEISAAEAAARVTLPVPTQEDDDKAIVWDATGGAWVLSTPPCDPAQMQELEQSVQSMVTVFSTVTAALDRHAQDTAAHPGISVANATAWGGSEKFVSTAAPDGALGKNGDIYIQLI